MHAVPTPPFSSNCPQERLPGARPGGEPLPEGMLWLLLTGQASGCATVVTCRCTYACSKVSAVHVQVEQSNALVASLICLVARW